MAYLKDMVFEDDELAIGKWEFWDKIESVEQFKEVLLDKKTCDYDFKTIYFLPNGQGYWIFEGWTKGKLFVHYGGDLPVLCYEYKIKQTHSGDFMFVFVENEDEKFIYVLKRSSAKRFAFDDIRKIEDVNLPFEFDEQIVGKWKSIAYVENMDDFENKNYDKDLRLWLEDIEFFEDGKVVRKYFDCTWEDRWTKGKLLDQKKSVVSNYYFKTINGKQIMFLEWKMGNYVYGGMPATFYVFEKV